MKISLILPYWDRKEAADEALRRLDALYADLDLEVIVVDDGNRERYVPPPGRLDIRVIYGPEKDEPKSPCTCWNVGVRAATGDLLALSCVEILHADQVLQQLAATVMECGHKAYALAAAWCPELREWHCHSAHRSAGAPEMPAGFGRAFLGVLHRSLYEAAGGWDEDYRDGAGWEDLDFARRLERAGALPIFRDDLVVIHPKKGASIRWGAEKFARNEALYREKWAC